MAGLYVGQATAYTLNVSFFDAASAFLGSVTVTGAGDGVSFAGWKSDGAKIKSIRVGNSVANGYVLAAQSGYLQSAGAVPEPATWAMMLAGFALIGCAMRRRKANTLFA